MKPLIVFDWDGTIVKAEVAEEAALRRMKTLGIPFTKEQMKEAQKSHQHYGIVKKKLRAYVGTEDKTVLTTIMTNLFHLHYLAVVHEQGERVFYPGMQDLLRVLSKAYGLVIASTIREDIIVPSLERLGMHDLFEGVYANTPDLRFSKRDLLDRIAEHHGRPVAIVGDRKEDMEAGKHVGARGIFVSWGAEEHADGSTPVKNAKELKEKIISSAGSSSGSKRPTG